MGVEIEIIPGSVESLVVGDIVDKLGGMQAVRVVDAVSGAAVDPNAALMDGSFSFLIAGNEYVLQHIPQGFDAYTGLEYLEGLSSEGLNFDEVAQSWERAGVSFYLSSDEFGDEDSNIFIAVVAAIASVMKGFVLPGARPWGRHALCTAEQFLARFRRWRDEGAG